MVNPGGQGDEFGSFRPSWRLYPQEGFHLTIPIRFAVPEGVDVFWCLTRGLFGFGGFRFRRHE